MNQQPTAPLKAIVFVPEVCRTDEDNAYKSVLDIEAVARQEYAEFDVLVCEYWTTQTWAETIDAAERGPYGLRDAISRLNGIIRPRGGQASPILVTVVGDLDARSYDGLLAAVAENPNLVLTLVALTVDEVSLPTDQQLWNLFGSDPRFLMAYADAVEDLTLVPETLEDAAWQLKQQTGQMASAK